MAHLGHGVMSPAIRAEPVGTREEIRLEDRLQDQLEHTLDHPIPQRGNTEPATFQRPRLRDHPLPHRDRVETTVFDLSPQPVEEHPDSVPGLYLVNGLPVHPGRACSLIAPHTIPGHQQETRIADKVVQIIEPAIGIIDRPPVQLGLDLPYPSLSPIQLMLQFIGVHQWPPGIPASSPPTCWPPSPSTELSSARTTTGPPPHPAALSRRRACPRPGWLP